MFVSRATNKSPLAILATFFILNHAAVVYAEGIRSKRPASTPRKTVDSSKSTFQTLRETADKEVSDMERCEDEEEEEKTLQDITKRAWVTILTGDSYNNTMMIGAQILSLREHSSYEHVTMVLPSVSSDTRNLLENKFGSKVVEISSIKPPGGVDNSLYEEAFSKLHVWNLTQYEQVTYLDGDVFFFPEFGTNDIFDLCDVEFCGSERKNSSILTDEEPNPLWINTGVMVVRPNKEHFKYLVNERLPIGLTKPVFCEEGFVSDALVDPSKPIGSYKVLDWRYNTCTEDYLESIQKCLNVTNTKMYKGKYSSPDFFDCFNPVATQVIFHHHCGPYRLTYDALCSWDTRGENNICRNPTVRKFQDLIVQVNECAPGGQNEDSCLSYGGGQCQWCSEDVRCIPHNEQCYLKSKDTLTLKSRRVALMGMWKDMEKYYERSEKRRVRKDKKKLEEETQLDENDKMEKLAWATILTGESYNNTMLIATQILSIREYSLYDHITMVLPSVGDETRAYLQSLGSTVVPVNPIYPPVQSSMPWYGDIFSKLNVFNLVNYDQIALVDGDAFLMNPRGDNVFNECDKDFCAVERIEEARITGNSPRPYINGGLIVIRPNKERFNYLVHERLPKGFKKTYFSDEGFFGELLTEKSPSSSPLGSHKMLEWVYNSCSEPFFDKVDECLKTTDTVNFKNPSIDFVDCFNSFAEDIAIVLYCGSYRLTTDKLCIWDIDKSNQFCQLDIVNEFQKLMIDANPCSVGGQDEKICNSYGGGKCHWCGDDVRCIPNDFTCYADSIDSKLLAKRAKLVLSEWDGIAKKEAKQERRRTKVKNGIRRRKNIVLNNVDKKKEYYSNNDDEDRILLTKRRVLSPSASVILRNIASPSITSSPSVVANLPNFAASPSVKASTTIRQGKNKGYHTTSSINHSPRKHHSPRHSHFPRDNNGY